MRRLLPFWLAAVFALLAAAAGADSPTGSAEPARPQDQEPTAEPPLPAGLGGLDEPADQPETRDQPRPSRTGRLTGFVELRGGSRLQDDDVEKRSSIGELRLQLDGEWEAGRAALFRAAGDVLYDPVEAAYAVDLETGRGMLDLREANVVLRPLGSLDIKAGRQILTWGTGDLLFLNDLFPKDFRAFFIGRHDEYLKAPSDAVKVSLFTAAANVDVVYTPRFDADRFIDGSRLSFFNPATGGRSGRDAPLEPVRRDGWFEDDEVAVRVYRQIGSYETAAYLYDGFWKAPTGALPDGTPFFPKLSAYGASVRGPFAGGIGNAEVAFYDSREPRSAGARVPSSEIRALAGVEREVFPELTLGVQYYAEGRTGADASDATRHLLTLRVTRLAMRQNLTASLFAFWSPDEGDGHGRLRVGYKVTDAWLVEGGLNLLRGPRVRPFGQLRDNTNVFASVRRSFSLR